MKKLIFLITLFCSFICLGQAEKETAYLLFDTTNKEKISVEDGAGNSSIQSKYRKLSERDFVYYYVDNEQFSTHKTKSQRDTLSIKDFKKIKFVDLTYIKDKKAKNIIHYNPFKETHIYQWRHYM